MHWSYEKQKTEALLSRCPIWEHCQAQLSSHSGAVSAASNMPVWKWDCKPFLALKGTFVRLLSISPLQVLEEVGNKRMTLRSHLREGKRCACFGKSPRWTRRKNNEQKRVTFLQTGATPLSRPPASPNRVSLLILPLYGHCYSCWNSERKANLLQLKRQSPSLFSSVCHRPFQKSTLAEPQCSTEENN